MKSPSCLFIVSVQLVLHTGKSYSLPSLKIDEKDALITSMSRVYPTIKRDDETMNLQWQKRNPPELQQGSTTLAKKGGVRRTKGRKYKAVYRDDLDMKEENEVPISQASYHAKALGINAVRVGKELFHGPVRAVAEMPISGLVGAVRNAGAVCRDAAGCRVDRAVYHLGAAVGRAALGVTAFPLYVGTAGVVNAVPAAGRVAKHFVGMTGHGVKQGFDHVVHGKKSKKTVQHQYLLEQARKRHGVLPKGTGFFGEELRSAPRHLD